MNWEAFFTVHCDLPREGPGLPGDVAWVADVLALKRDGRVLDAGCGPGGDLAALRRAVPDGEVYGIEGQAQFVETARARHGEDPGIRVEVGDMATPGGGAYDLIWSAGAVYFLGVPKALDAWRPRLAPGGAVAFSHPFLAEDASEAARAFWGEDPCGTEAATRAEITAAGWGVIAARPLEAAAWNAYYGPLLARCDALEAQADPDVAEVIAQSRQEAANWRAVQHETGYMLYVVRPV